MKYKASIQHEHLLFAKNEMERDKIVSGLLNSGYIVGSRKSGAEFEIYVYERIIEYKHEYADCACQIKE